MQMPSKATWASIAIATAIAVVLYLWSWLEPACLNQQRRIVMKMSGGVGCAEFWLNRYQSLISAVIAAAVALYVVRPVFRQLREMARQSAVQLLERTETIARELENEREAVRAWKGLGGSCVLVDLQLKTASQQGFTSKSLASFVSTSQDLLASLRTMEDELKVMRARRPPTAQERQSRQDLLDAIEHLREKLADIKLETQISAMSSNGTVPASSVVGSTVIDAFREQAEVARSRVKDFISASGISISQAWAEAEMLHKDLL